MVVSPATWLLCGATVPQGLIRLLYEAPDAIAPGAITSCSVVSEFCMVFHFLFHFWYSHCDTGRSASARPKNIPTPARRGSTAPAPAKAITPLCEAVHDPFSHKLITGYYPVNDRTGGQRRIREEAGDTLPARAPAACIPKQVIRWIGALVLSKSPKSPHVNVMEM